MRMTPGIHLPPAAFAMARPRGGAATRVDGQAKTAMDQSRARLVFCMFVVAALYSILCGRLVDLGLSAITTGDIGAPKVHATDIRIERGDITDRNGVLIATNLTTKSLFANTKIMQDKNEAARKLAKLFPELSEKSLKGKLNSGKSFVWIRRNLNPREQLAVNNLGIPGLNFQTEERRIYPQGDLLAHVLGYVGTDGHGLAGIEKNFDDHLLSHAAADKPLALSVDVRVQNILRNELAGAAKEFSAIGAAGVVMDVNTGEILGMASLPDFNPNRVSKESANDLFNRVLAGVYEMGSTMKTLTMAMALDSGRVHMSDTYDATNPIKIGRFSIDDFHAKHRVLTVPEVFMYSSNIGTAKMALDVGTEGQKSFFKKAGLLKPMTIEMPERPRPLFPSNWTKVNTMTIAFGHGIAISPLHLVSSISAIANDGVMRHPTLLKTDMPEEGVRLIKERTTDKVRRLMRLVVTNGSGKNANVPGYLVGGKTGTAEKLGGGKGYKKDARLSSFIGVFPIHKPRYAVLVMIDEPKGTKATGGYATGGAVAAPAAGRVITRIAPMLGVQPVDENSPQIREATYIDYEMKGQKVAAAQ